MHVINRVNMPGLVSHSTDDFVEDKNEPNGDFDGFGLADMIDNDSFRL